MTLFVIAAALASEPAPDVATSRAFVPRPLIGRPLVELRGGLDTVSAGQAPSICGELHLLRFLSVDACGTGSKLFHDRPIDEMSHYRVEADVPLVAVGRTELWLQPGVGFAEVQRGADAAGFRFGRQVAPDQAEAAGPEVSLSVKGRAWMHEGIYAVAELHTGVAFVPAAPQAVGLRGPVLPSAGITAGLGF